MVQRKATDAKAESWLTGLPQLIAQLEREWDIVVGRPFDEGTEAYVAAAVLGDGRPAVLKLLVPRHNAFAVNEITVLRLAGGAGCPELYRYDVDRGAMLMERLGPSLFRLGLPIDRRHRTCAMRQHSCGVRRRTADCRLGPRRRDG